MSGWIKIHRKILDWEWSTKPLTFRLFIHLLLKANITDNYWRGSFIPAGSLIAGRAKLAQECGMTEREVRTALTHLKTTNEVTIKTTKEYSIISITNWKNYQASDQQNANERPTNDQPTTTLKEYKNIRIKEDKKDYTDDFEILWNSWVPFEMQKGNKKTAIDAYTKAMKETTPDIVLSKSIEYTGQCARLNSKTKHVTTWLNQKGWNDEYSPMRIKPKEEKSDIQRQLEDIAKNGW